MTTSDPRSRILSVLYSYAEHNEKIDLFVVAEAAGLNLYTTLAALNELGEAGLVWPARLRLTMTGLAIATQLSAPRWSGRVAEAEPVSSEDSEDWAEDDSAEHCAA